MQARDGWREREHERGMLREKGGIFIAAAVFIAAQRRRESGRRGLGCGFHSASHERERERGRGREERGSSGASEREREGRLFGIFGRRGKK